MRWCNGNCFVHREIEGETGAELRLPRHDSDGHGAGQRGAGRASVEVAGGEAFAGCVPEFDGDACCVVLDAYSIAIGGRCGGRDVARYVGLHLGRRGAGCRALHIDHCEGYRH